MYFSNPDQLLAYLNTQVVNEISSYSAAKIYEYLRAEIWNKIYLSYEPREYHRTYEYLNSLRVTSINGKIKIYYDLSSIHAYEVWDSLWNQHMSSPRDKNGNKIVGAGTDVSSEIPEWMELGTRSPSYWPRQGVSILDNLDGGDLEIFVINAIRELGYELTYV